ncbi:MAG: hypothetical protein L6Q98_18505 [Anaerolineae bacterium]|nr:hypothetical protein [Anaerolineae bacterium]NUQ06838.1 hypothetical protein [Anaerolineae bacterium]
MRIFATLMFAILALVGLSVFQSSAAQVADVCPQFIADAIETVGNNCTGLTRNSACYGYDQVVAAFSQVTATDFFTRPRDIADLTNLTSIATSPLRTALDEWGISLLSVQANLPDALPGQNVIFMLAGDVELENAVDAETAADPNSVLSPAQAFYFRTGIAQTECREAPDALIIQGPKNTQVDFTANGADIRIGSTVALRTLPVDPAQDRQIHGQYGFDDDIFEIMELFVLDGRAILNPGTPDEQIIPEGYRGLRCLAAPQNLGLDGDEDDRQVFTGCPWVDIRPATDEEIGEFRGYQGVVLNYRIELPLTGTEQSADSPTAPPVPPTSTTVPPTPTHTDVPLTPTHTQVPNSPPLLSLEIPGFSIARDAFVLSGSVYDPDSSRLTLSINWGDGSAPEEFVYTEGPLAAGGFAPAFANPVVIAVEHDYPHNGIFPLVALLQDDSGNSAEMRFDALIDPIMPLVITNISGDGQSAAVNEPFAEPLVAQVIDKGGAGVPVIYYGLSISYFNSVLGCAPETCLLTDFDGKVHVAMIAGPITGPAEVDIKTDIHAPDSAHYDLSVLSAVNHPPTVAITNVETTWQNGDLFTLHFAVDDLDGDPIDAEVYWDDSFSPDSYNGIAPGSTFNADHEFSAAGIMYIKVVITDGEFVVQDEISLDVKPIYPLWLNLVPQAGWTGEAATGELYMGTLRAFVYDSQNDPVYGAPLLNLSKGGLIGVPPSPGTPVTLGGPGGGSRDLQVIASCYPLTVLEIASPDPLGSYYDEGTGERFSYASLSVNQYSAYNFTNVFGDNQETTAGSDFPLALGVELKSASGSPIGGAEVVFTIQDPPLGAIFKTSGLTEHTAVTDPSGFAFADTITSGDEGYLSVYAEYHYGSCVLWFPFLLTVKPKPAIPPLDAEATPEVTPEVNPEATPEATPEPDPTDAPEVTPEIGATATPTPTPTDAPEVTPEVTPEAPSSTKPKR